MSVEEVVLGILSNYQEIKGEVLPESSLKDLGLSSLGIVSVVMDLEDEWNFICSDEEESKIKTVKDLFELVKNHT